MTWMTVQVTCIAVILMSQAVTVMAVAGRPSTKQKPQAAKPQAAKPQAAKPTAAKPTAAKLEAA